MSGQCTGYLSMGFSEEYNRMAPADMYMVWLDATTGAAVLSHRQTTFGYDAPVVVPLADNAVVNAARLVTGRNAAPTLTARITVPMPAGLAAYARAIELAAGVNVGRRLLQANETAPPPPPPTAQIGVLNLIWSISDSVPSSQDGALVQHGNTEDTDYGAASIDLFCNGGRDKACVLALGGKLKSRFTRLHAITLAGFFGTLLAGMCVPSKWISRPFRAC
jgi:hypothetical protein